jgi:hypothetical protein
VVKLTLANLLPVLFLNVFLAAIFYLVTGYLFRGQAVKTALATCVFLVFFNIYGLAYRYLIDLDVIRIKHYTLLPLVLLFAYYAVLPIHRLKSSSVISLWKNLVVIAGFLVVYNTINIAQAEFKRWRSETSVQAAHLPVEAAVPADSSLPDIYFIILDEFAGFQAMREYWQYEDVDDFVRFLEERNFFVAEQSHGSSSDTLHQMASRLNYQEYPVGEEYIQVYFDDIADNRVMRYLKSQGYTTVVFDETNLGYPAAPSIKADYLYEYGDESISQKQTGQYGLYLDEFGELVMDNTMFNAISREYTKDHPLVSQHSSMIFYTVDHIADEGIPSPKFVYVHLMLPHTPFIFTRNGEIAENQHFTDWKYYIENYIFSITIARTLVDEIRSKADPENPPVIILQSDHGARNHLGLSEGSAILPNYPDKYKTLILNAIYLPGFDYSTLPQNMNPTNTFPIVFNHLFNTDITLLE